MMKTLLLALLLIMSVGGLAIGDGFSGMSFDSSVIDSCTLSDGNGNGEVSLGDLQSVVNTRESAGGRRFYLAGIVGASFATLTQPDLAESNAILNQTLFTGGGAAGWAFERPNGWWRAEFEARSRERMQFTETDPFAGTTSFHANDGWSTMANLWRDLNLTDRAGIYLGGGIGAGGYRTVFSGETLSTTLSGSTGITSFAWQAGGGVTYAFNPRVTLDLGYRFFSLSPGVANIYTTNDSGTLHDTVKTQFAASEMVLSLRIYEPFRRWR